MSARGSDRRSISKLQSITPCLQNTTSTRSHHARASPSLLPQHRFYASEATDYRGNNEYSPNPPPPMPSSSTTRRGEWWDD